VDCAAESALIIASHLARMSKDFLPALSECGALNFAERALQSDIPAIRAKGLDFVGNVCRHTALPDDCLEAFVPLLMMNLDDPEPICQKLAAFAIGNVLFWSPEMSERVIDGVQSITSLLRSPDLRTVDNAAGVLGNLVRKSGQFVATLISEGAVDALVRTISDQPALEGRTILPLAAFCQYESGRAYLKAIGSQSVISKYTGSSNERIGRYSRNIISSLS